MPILKSAIKKLKQDRKRAKVNQTYRLKLRQVIKEIRKKLDKKKLPEAYRAIDKAAKKKVIHKNKAARLKSRLARLLKKKKMK